MWGSRAKEKEPGKISEVGTNKSDADKLTLALLKAQDDRTTNSVIQVLNGSPKFINLANLEGQQIRDRDDADASALEAGITFAKNKGVLPKDLKPMPYEEIDVLGKSADQVAQEIVCRLGEAAQKGCVVVIVGLSGTGKGTTVQKLRDMLPNTAAWSNGNCFRALTLLAVKHCEMQAADQSKGGSAPVGKVDAQELAPGTTTASFEVLAGVKVSRKYLLDGDESFTWELSVGDKLTIDFKVTITCAQTKCNVEVCGRKAALLGVDKCRIVEDRRRASTFLGCLNCKDLEIGQIPPGSFVTLEFDNSFSYFRSKRIMLRLVKKPSAQAATPVQISTAPKEYIPRLRQLLQEALDICPAGATDIRGHLKEAQDCFKARYLTSVNGSASQGSSPTEAVLDPSVLTPERLAAWCNMLSFGKFEGVYDIKIAGNGVDACVSKLAKTVLMEPSVVKNLPVVAKQTQGEVVKFAAEAVTKMGAEGTVVLLEGREQTLDFIPTPFRFRLVLSEQKLIGQRRAAQRIAAAALQKVPAEAQPAQVQAALMEQLDALTAKL